MKKLIIFAIYLISWFYHWIRNDKKTWIKMVQKDLCDIRRSTPGQWPRLQPLPNHAFTMSTSFRSPLQLNMHNNNTIYQLFAFTLNYITKPIVSFSFAYSFKSTLISFFSMHKDTLRVLHTYNSAIQRLCSCALQPLILHRCYLANRQHCPTLATVSPHTHTYCSTGLQTSCTHAGEIAKKAWNPESLS